MPYAWGTVEAGEKAARVCAVPEGGVLVKNLGGSRIYLGGADVGTEGETAGFPLDQGESQLFPGIRAREAPVVPSPPTDLSAPALYARTAVSAGVSKVAWIAGAW
jgi:hypothetical protein